VVQLKNAAVRPHAVCRKHPLASASLPPMEFKVPPDSDASVAKPLRSQAPAEHDRATPMMAQYLEIKGAHPDCLLFYRMGDFYELFFRDAEIASRALGIVLTKRGKHLGEDIPMCGVPVERAEEYLHRLIALGHRVAVGEQLENPAEARKRGPKSVVRRDVVRLVTPGTLTEDSLLDARRNNYLAAVARARVSLEHHAFLFAIAFLDMSTGEFRVREVEPEELGSEIARLDPGEILVSDALYDDADLAKFWRAFRAVTPVPRQTFDGAEAERRVAGYFGVATMEAFGAFSRLELTAAAACLLYLERTQQGKKPLLLPLVREARGASLVIDSATRANLELVRTLAGDRSGSLLAAVDRSVTAAGARLLAQRLVAPLTDPLAISERLDGVAALVGEAELRRQIIVRLKTAPDLARALARLAIGRGGPRDLAAVRDGLTAAADLAACVRRLDNPPRELAEAARMLATPDAALAPALSAALGGDLPPSRRDGGFVRPGYSSDLDEALALRDESRRVLAALQARYAEETGLRSLRIRHNHVLGFFIEASTQHGEKLLREPFNTRFVHRQTLAGQIRFTTAELLDIAGKIAQAADRALALELAIFDELVEKLVACQETIQSAAQGMAAIDVMASLASLAVERNYVRPEITAGLDFCIDNGRHPVVEQAVMRTGDSFVANDCDLSPPQGADAGQIWIVTGPNMAGKSTFLRQNALIAVLAQMGSFVPAERARIGAVDRLFSRVGAADDLARGRSTFMVEMIETAAILNQAGRRSLVILDEIGRGTATFDGLAIAWASIEHLHEANRCRALFATHFHELTKLASNLSRLFNATARVKEWQGDVVFLHEIVPGAADRSYGIQVAKLAGLPTVVIDRAKLVLAELEAEDRASAARTLVDDLPLFSEARRPNPGDSASDREPDPLLAELLADLAALDPDSMSPRQALELLYVLKRKAASRAS
jgi:DNA mismatch repair protein MutS